MEKQGKNTLKHRLRAMILLFVMFSMVILMANLVSSFEFDNVKSYNAQTKTATITNAFGLGEKLADVQLKTNTALQVGLGYQKVFEYEINSLTDYTSFIKETEIYNLKRAGTKENKNLDLKYLTYKDVEVNDYISVCEYDKNSMPFNCKQELKGKHTETQAVWNDLKSMDMKAEKMIISGWADVKQGDYYEWIPNFAGVQVSEWATWSGNLSLGLVSYWKADEDYLDALGINDGTNSGTANVSGKIKYGWDFEAGESDSVTIGTAPTLSFTTGDFAIVGWYKMESALTESIFGECTNGAGEGGYGFYIQTNQLVLGKGNTDESPYSTPRLQTGVMDLVAMSYNQATDEVTFYINTTSDVQSYSSNFADVEYCVGKYVGTNYLDGVLDELMIFNRTLSSTEVTYLYNLGNAGCSYGNESCFTGGDATPTIALNSPADAITSNNYLNTFSCTGTDDSKIQNISFYVNGSLNQTNTSVFNNTATTFSTSLADGFYNWSCKVWDNATTPQSAISTRTLTINISSPIVTLNSPANNYNSTNSNIIFECQASDSYGLTNISLMINGTINQTNTSVYNNTPTLFVDYYADGFYNWSCNAWNINLKSTTAGYNNFSIDTLSPIITITSPLATIDYQLINTNQVINWSITDAHLDKCWYNYKGTNTTMICANNFININMTDYLYRNLTFWANDTFGNTASQYFGWEYRLFENSRTYNPFSIEGSIETFYYDFYAPTITNANLYWNSTSKTSTLNSLGSNRYNATTSFLIPNIASSTNVSLFWNVNINSSYGLNSTANQQNISAILIDDCSVYGRVVLNYSLQDEALKTIINTTLNPCLTEVSLSIGNIINFSGNFTNNNNPRICLNLNNLGTLNSSMNVQTKYSATSYASEFSNLQNFFVTNTSIPLNIPLYDLNSSSSTEFLITAKGENSLPLQNALINLTRKYISDGIYRSVEIPTSDTYGQAKLHIDTNNVLYRLSIEKNGAMLQIFDVTPICENSLTATCNINLDLSSGGSNFDETNISGDLVFDLRFNQTNRNITFTFSSYSGNSYNMSVSATEFGRFENVSLCGDYINSSSGILICHIPISYGNTSLIYTIYKNGIIFHKGTLDISPTSSQIYGTTGIILAFLLMLTIPLMFSGHPIGMILGVFISFILIGSLMLIDVGSWVGMGSTMMWIVISGGILLWKLTKT